MPLELSSLESEFRIPHPDAKVSPEEYGDVIFIMTPLTQHQITALYDKRINPKNNKGIANFMEDQWVKSLKDWEGITEQGVELDCTEAEKRKWFANPALKPLIDHLLTELENKSREQHGIEEKN